jgi:hypothetical protein
MNTRNNKNSIKTSIFMAILAFAIFMSPNISLADYGTNYSFGGNTGINYNTGQNYQPYNYGQYNPYQYQNVYQPPVTFQVIPTSQAPAPEPTPTKVYSNGTNPEGTVAKKTTTVAKAKAPTEYALAYVPVSKLASVGAIRANNETTTNPNGSSLTANVLDGYDGFLPKGIIGWILFAIFLLIIIILVRKIFGAESRYLASPLKHD